MYILNIEIDHCSRCTTSAIITKIEIEFISINITQSTTTGTTSIVDHITEWHTSTVSGNGVSCTTKIICILFRFQFPHFCFVFRRNEGALIHESQCQQYLAKSVLNYVKCLKLSIFLRYVLSGVLRFVLLLFSRCQFVLLSITTISSKHRWISN